jgi:magnesium chelatase family protein
MLATIHSGTTFGTDAILIEVEVDVSSRGLPALTIVGLPDKAVQEAKERVRAALLNSGADIPPRRITFNLAPADIPKAGPAFDLAMAIGLMIASGEITKPSNKAVFYGELSLDGSLRRTAGCLPVALMAQKEGISTLYLPAANVPEVSFIKNITVYPISNIKQLVLHLNGTKLVSPTKLQSLSTLLSDPEIDIDMADIYGQEQSKRALEIAAAGGHNIHLTGLPGAGKTLMSRAMPGILPRLTEAEALEITKIYSTGGLIPDGTAIITTRPFRSPHHTTSKVGLIGGGTLPRPGEISLAHRGVLFLDEFPEFPRSVIESLRQPLEDGYVHIARASLSTRFPSRFALVAASNPCPCGHLGDPKKACICSGSQISRYQKKISGPMMDRIDLHVTVPAVPIKKLIRSHNAESSRVIQVRVQKARNLQTIRYKGTKLTANAELDTKAISAYCHLGELEKSFLTQATAKLGLTARSYYKTIKVARTIADLAGEGSITKAHLSEALQYRPSEHFQ